VPNPYEAVLLALAAWRVWHLIALDDLTDRPRRYVTDGRDKLLEFVECPYCLGAWSAFAWVAAFAIWPDETPWAALPFAVSAGVIAAARVMSSD
jgi:hypothetical protein